MPRARCRPGAGALQYCLDYRGTARVLIDPVRGTVVGATFAGPGVAGLLHSATVANTGEVPVERRPHGHHFTPRSPRMAPTGSAVPELAEKRRASGEPVLVALAIVAGVINGPPAGFEAWTAEVVTTVLAGVGDAVAELEAARQRRALGEPRTTTRGEASEVL
ncbi:hypothetical protein ACIQB5_50800 [Streptomyces sp. NPDC088560]|uniref:hypothetical protein n=1 Tax=Streptomyces sp. NPDC088560 TaxID=3365868 RepID=UPI0038028303